MIPSFKSVLICPLSVLILHILLLGTSCGAKKNHTCPASSCGEFHNISYPFRLKGDPKDCGSPEYELACENNRTVLYLYAGRYYVKSIFFDYYHNEDDFVGIITVVDDGLQKGDCSSLPRYSLAPSNFSDDASPYFPSSGYSLAFVKCSQPIASASYVDTKPCIDGAHSAETPTNVSQMKVYSYALPGDSVNGERVRDVEDSCTITMMSLASVFQGDQYNHVSSPYKDFHNVMAEGFYLKYQKIFFMSERRIRFCNLISIYQGKECRYDYYHGEYYYPGKRLFVKLFVLPFFFFVLLLNVHQI